MLKNNKLFKCLYYLAFLLAVIIFVTYRSYVLSKVSYGLDINFIELLFANMFPGGFFGICIFYINIFMVIFFTILLLLKKEIKNVNVLFPAIFILYLVILIVVSVMFTDRVVEPYVQYEYYMTFIYAGYLFLNVYTLLSIEWKKKKVEAVSVVTNQMQDNNVIQPINYTQNINHNFSQVNNNSN